MVGIAGGMVAVLVLALLGWFVVLPIVAPAEKPEFPARVGDYERIDGEVADTGAAGEGLDFHHGYVYLNEPISVTVYAYGPTTDLGLPLAGMDGTDEVGAGECATTEAEDPADQRTACTTRRGRVVVKVATTGAGNQLDQQQVMDLTEYFAHELVGN